MDVNEIVKKISNPSKLYARSEVLFSGTKTVPAKSGFCAFFFKSTFIPSDVPTEGCVACEDKTLLYVGMSRNLRGRINQHFMTDSSWSTLRLSLGVLLSQESGYQLRRVAPQERITLTNSGEEWLNEWMDENAFVMWLEYENPANFKKEVIKRLFLPLNIQDNKYHPSLGTFSRTLSSMRSQAKAEARELSVVT